MPAISEDDRFVGSFGRAFGWRLTSLGITSDFGVGGMWLAMGNTEELRAIGRQHRGDRELDPGLGCEGDGASALVFFVAPRGKADYASDFFFDQALIAEFGDGLPG